MCRCFDQHVTDETAFRQQMVRFTFTFPTVSTCGDLAQMSLKFVLNFIISYTLA